MRSNPPRHDRFAALALVLVAVFGLCLGRAHAVPAFGAQTGQTCQGCHIGGFGPQLTPYGRAFKLGGYTQRAGKWNIPLSAMAIGSYTRTRADQNPPPTPDYASNDNTTLDQVSLFLAGGVGSHFGGFVQVTYDGVNRIRTWDNLDLRAVTTATVLGKDAVFGLSLNNSPGVQDVWNTLPAWGYPYTGSALAPSPATRPLFAGGLAQNTIGLTGYAWIDSKIYIEGGGYRSPARSTLQSFGVDPFAQGDINGIAPYGRIAYQKSFGTQNIEVGAFLLRAALFPGRDRSTGRTDQFTDTGVDASWQKVRANSDTVTLNARYTHEAQLLNASYALGNAGNVHNQLDDERADITYYFHNRYGGTVGMFNTSGTADPLLYGGSRTFSPDSTGFLFQLDATLFGGDTPLGKRFNARTGVQYTAYTRFDGAASNYDGAGANASANNTARIFLWLAY